MSERENTRTIPNAWIERVEQRVKELLRKENYSATVMAAQGVPPDDGVLRPALIRITPREQNAWKREFEIGPPQTGDDSNLNVEAGRILKQFNVTLQKGEMVSDYDPLDPNRP